MKFVLFILFFIPIMGVCQFSYNENKTIDTKISAAIKPVQSSIANLATSISSQTTKEVALEKTILTLTAQIKKLEDTIKFLKAFAGSDFVVDKLTGVIMISPSAIARIKVEVKKP